MNADCCYKLYMHVNKTNGKVYIGQTKKSYLSRWRNGKGYGGCPMFAKAIKKYGWHEGFEHIPLIEGLFKSEADYFERFFIEFFDSQNLEFGYNLTAGGDENPMDCPELVAKKTESLKQYYENNPELREKVRQHNNLLWSNPDSIFYSSEYRKKQRLGIQNKFGKKVRCIETGETYNCLADAARAIGVKSHTAITICCNNPKRTAKGMHWQFA